MDSGKSKNKVIPASENLKKIAYYVCSACKRTFEGAPGKKLTKCPEHRGDKKYEARVN